MTEKCAKCGKFVSDEAPCSYCQQLESDKKKSADQTSSATNNGPVPDATAGYYGRIELPPFYAEDVTIWWSQVERRLALANLTTEKTRYDYVTAALPMEVARKVSDLISKEPAHLPFTTLKQRILGEFEPTNSEKLNKLLEGCELGDKKPSALLREMKELAGGRVDNDILRKLFFKQLPDFLTKIFITTSVTDLDAAAAAADKAKEEGMFTSNTVLAVKSGTTPTSAPSQNISELVIALTESVQQLLRDNQNYRSRSRSRNSSRSNSRNRDRSESNNRKFTKCRYHYKFGDKARHCRRWCEKYDEFSKNKPSAEN